MGKIYINKNPFHQEETEYYNNIASDNGKGAVRLRQRKNGKNKEKTIDNIDMDKWLLGSTNCHLLNRF